MFLSRVQGYPIRYAGDAIGGPIWLGDRRLNAHMRACRKALKGMQWKAGKGSVLMLTCGENRYFTLLDACTAEQLSAIIRGLTIEALNDVIKDNQVRLDRNRRRV